MGSRSGLLRASLVVALGLTASAAAAETPKYGGMFNYMIPADGPPSFDGYCEAAYATVHISATGTRSPAEPSVRSFVISERET